MGILRFKRTFDSIAVKKGWCAVKGGWVRGTEEKDECIVSIDLQKSSHAKHFYLNMQIYVQGAFGRTFDRDLDVRKAIPTAFRRLPNDFNDVFDLTSLLPDEERLARINTVFCFLECFAHKASTRSGLLELENEGEIHLVAGVRKEIQRLVNS
jgi:hypothetical protein